MDFIILIALSVVSALACMNLAKLTKVPAVIFMMLIGVVLGPYVLDLAEGLEPMAKYSSFAIIALFLVSGYGLNVEAIKASGKKTFGLSSVPAIGEGLIMGVVAYLILSVIPVFGSQEILFPAVMVIMLVFAMSSPAIIIPFTMQGKARGMTFPIFDELTIASVIDNFIPFPFAIVFLNVAYAIASGEGINVGSIAFQSIAIVVAIIVVFIISYFIGKLSALLNKVVTNPQITAVIVLIITVVAVLVAGPIGASLGIIIGLGIGVGYNVSTEPQTRMAVLGMSQKIYGLGLMPIVFIYVGTQIQLDQLLKPTTVIAFTIITIIGMFIKGFIAKKYLASQGSDPVEGQLAAYGFAAKGIILINISLVIGTGLTENGLDYILQMMYMLAAVSIIISIPYSSVKLGSHLDVMEEASKK
ncbi:cation:proton antiporter [Mollicutes bacterium LVI A0039]|nr:cation:proton antiporter [Mollicutes bacterium LVI A0039]